MLVLVGTILVKTFVAPFLSTPLTALGSPRMVGTSADMKSRLLFTMKAACLLYHDQSQQRSRHATGHKNTNLLTLLLAVYFSHAWLPFLLQYNYIPEIFLVFTVLPVWLQHLLFMQIISLFLIGSNPPANSSPPTGAYHFLEDASNIPSNQWHICLETRLINVIFAWKSAWAIVD